MTTDYERIGGPAVGAVYRRVGTHLIECLQDAGVPDDIQDRVGAALGQARGSIVARQT